jgi:hypothetical protein
LQLFIRRRRPRQEAARGEQQASEPARHPCFHSCRREPHFGLVACCGAYMFMICSDFKIGAPGKNHRKEKTTLRRGGRKGCAEVAKLFLALRTRHVIPA